MAVNGQGLSRTEEHCNGSQGPQRNVVLEKKKNVNTTISETKNVEITFISKL
jgi:hypothetical protein